MTYYNKCIKYIETATDHKKIYDDIRAILKEAADKETFLKSYYPEDWQIKRIQRAADAKYLELGGH